MKRVAMAAVVVGLFVIALAIVPLITAQQTENAPSEADQIKQLQKERVRVLSDLVRMMAANQASGMNVEIKQQFTLPETELINAQLETAESTAQRVVLLEDQAKNVKAMLDLVERRFAISTRRPYRGLVAR
jgi:hypothetical protein